MVKVMDCYRFARRLHLAGIPLVPKLIDYAVRLLFAGWVPHTAQIGRRVVLGYGALGIVIHARAVIGDDVHIDQGVTIGGNGTCEGVPTVEEGVYIGAGAKILGPVRIGYGSVIGANSVVVRDVPPRCVAAGIPARIIRSDIDPETYLFHKRSRGVSGVR